MGHVSIYMEDDPHTGEFGFKIAFTGDFDPSSAAHRAAIHIHEFVDNMLEGKMIEQKEEDVAVPNTLPNFGDPIPPTPAEPSRLILPPGMVRL